MLSIISFFKRSSLGPLRMLQRPTSHLTWSFPSSYRHIISEYIASYLFNGYGAPTSFWNSIIVSWQSSLWRSWSLTSRKTGRPSLAAFLKHTLSGASGAGSTDIQPLFTVHFSTADWHPTRITLREDNNPDSHIYHVGSFARFGCAVFRDILFFKANFLAAAAEIVMAKGSTLMGSFLPLPGSFCKAVGAAWVFTFFFCVTPVWMYPKVHHSLVGLIP